MDINTIEDEMKKLKNTEGNSSKGFVGVPLGNKLHSKLKGYCVKENTTMSNVVRTVMKNFLEKIK